MCSFVSRNEGDNGEKPEPCWEQECKRNRAAREHPIQFQNCAGSEYKHKGFIAGRSLLKAGANSPSSSTRRKKKQNNPTCNRRISEVERDEMPSGGELKVSSARSEESV